MHYFFTCTRNFHKNLDVSFWDIIKKILPHFWNKKLNPFHIFLHYSLLTQALYALCCCFCKNNSFHTHNSLTIGLRANMMVKKKSWNRKFQQAQFKRKLWEYIIYQTHIYPTYIFVVLCRFLNAFNSLEIIFQIIYYFRNLGIGNILW